MENLKNFFIAIVLFSIGILGLILGFQIGGRIEDHLYSGTPTPWILLRSPVRFAEIVDVNDTTIWVKTAEGNLYFGGLCFDTPESCNPEWEETPNIPSNIHNDEYWPEIVRGKVCPENEQTHPPELSGEIIECVTKNYWDGGPGKNYIALLKDGTLWQWHYFHPNNDVPIISLFIGPPIGLLLSIGTAVGLLRILQKKI